MKKTFWTIILLSFFMTVNLVAQTRGDGWPPANVLQEYSLSGMPQPIGSNEPYWRTDATEAGLGVFDVQELLIGFNGTNETNNAIINWFISNGWKQFEDERYFSKDNYVVFYRFQMGTTGQINVGKVDEDWWGWEEF